MAADEPGGRMEEFRERTSASAFTALELIDAQLAKNARERLVREFMTRAGLTESRGTEVMAATTIEVGEGLVRITLDDLGVITAAWDGSAETLYSIVADRAWAFSDTYKEDRGRYGNARWG